MLTGYDGVHPRSFVVAVGSQSAGNYTLRIADHAFLGHLTVYANQSLTIQGATSPVGQLPLVDANVHVLPKGKLLMDSVWLLGPAKVDPGGELVLVPAFCVYGAKANYSCPETGAAPSDGSAVRACEADGTWNGTAPTKCKMAGCKLAKLAKCKSKILTEASWGVQINSWLPSRAYILAIYSGVSAAQ